MGEQQGEEERTWQPTLPRLFDLWRLFLTHTNSEDLIEQLVRRLAEALGADRVSLMLLDEAERVLTVSAAVGLPADVVAGTRIALGEGIAGWVALTGQPLLLPEGPDVPAPLREAMGHEEITSALCVPLQVEGRVIGVLNLSRLDGRARFTPGHLGVVSLLAERAAIAIRIARLRSELRAGEEFVTRILESIPTSLLVLDRGLRIVSANRNFLDKARRTARLTIGRKMADVLPRALLRRTRLERMVEEVFRTGRPLEGGMLTYRAPGLPTRVYAYRLFPLKGQASVEHVVLLMDDVTERERLQEEARRAERHLAGVVECATDLVVSMSLDGRIASWNRAAEVTSGFAADEVRGRSLSSLCAAADGQAMERVVRAVGRGRPVQHAEMALRTREGREVPIAWNCAPMRDDQGKVTGIVAVGRDLTERRRMEAELLQSSKMASLGVMAGGIAHELRNPLGIIAAAAQLLVDRPDDERLRAEAVERIRSSVQRASLIIENLLRFAHPSTEHREDVDVNALVEETLGLLASRTTQQGVNVQRDLQPGLPGIQANRSLLQQVFTNILVNACNAMPQGGALAVATRAHPPGQVEIRFADTGCGIPPENLSRVFDPFFTTMPVGQGAGLGLAISYAIVKHHQGAIEVESEVGKGATFTVRLPIRPAPGAARGLLLRPPPPAVARAQQRQEPVEGA
jgi:PAS domain S-box-containing protein